MWKLVKNIIKNRLQTEPLVKKTDQIEILGKSLASAISKRFGRSLAIRMVDAGSCNLCELEILATTNPYYNIERFGIKFVASPRHADMLLVTGPVTKNMREALLKTYDAIPQPKLVVAIGDCAHCGGVFKDSDAVIGAVSQVIPVNTVVKGCPPTSIDIINGVLQTIKTL